MYPRFLKPEYQSNADYNTNAPSYYLDLAKKEGLIKELAHRIWEYDQILNAKLEEIEKVLTHYSDILDGKLKTFDETVFQLVNEWIEKNLHDLITEKIKTVWFGLTDDGHFMAVIPKSWEEIQFDTSNEGHLILEYKNGVV